jgi:hypothetical protein
LDRILAVNPRQLLEISDGYATHRQPATGRKKPAGQVNPTLPDAVDEHIARCSRGHPVLSSAINEYHQAA